MFPNNNPSIQVLDMPTADTEYAFAIPEFTKVITFKLRDQGTDLRIAWLPGLVASSTDPYMTIPANMSKTIKDFKVYADRNIYFATSTNSMKLEIELWQ